MAEGMGEGSALCVVSQAGFLNPCFNLQGLCDIARGLESAHPGCCSENKDKTSLPAPASPWTMVVIHSCGLQLNLEQKQANRLP